MSTPPTNTPEATARNRFGRKIDEAFEEASKLAGSSLPPSPRVRMASRWRRSAGST